MEVGNIAEWVAGISKVIAIIGAITLPIVREKKKRNNSVERLARREYSLVNDIIIEYKEKRIPIVELDSYKQFASFNSMLMIVSDDENLIILSEKINDLLTEEIDEDNFFSSINLLLKNLENTYIKK
ncbi:hypothetical protein FQS96_02085 [Enterococcus faecalis]|uniref:hypothetical protein n=1 Tax=Enterococcus TaxID=1350 RepID=UPI001A96B6DE|nr:hypothetical protein [Enterococcus faecalis]MBO1124260.1 hypothetical protein [Enterococcus faecalis]